MYEFAVTPAVTNIRRRGVEISEVAPDSLGADMDLESGDRIIKVNGRVVRDYLDFRFHTAGETELVLEVRKKSGEDWEVELERAEGEDFGLAFEQIVPRQCANECLFCFCKGNPDDARKSLFVRDEDVRLSFLYVENEFCFASSLETEVQVVANYSSVDLNNAVTRFEIYLRAEAVGCYFGDLDASTADICDRWSHCKFVHRILRLHY